jgi:O-antigen/teichoic acid export membrane protein
LLARTVHFGVQGQLSNLIQLLNYRLDTYLILIFVNASGVGLYAVGVSLSEGLWFIANSVTTVLQTNLTANDEAYAQRMTPIVCRNTLLVTAAASVGAAVTAPFIIPAVFGTAFDDAVEPFLWLLPGTVALAGTKVLAAYVFSRGRPMINAWIAFATLLVTVIAAVALIPPFGVPGAAVASSLAYGVSLSLTALAYARLSRGSALEALLPRPSDASLYIDVLRGLSERLQAGRHAQRVQNS